MHVKNIVNFVGKSVLLIVGLSFVVLIYLVVLYCSYEWQDGAELKNRAVVHFRIDSAFDSKERLKIESALNRWMEATDNSVILRYYVGDVTISDLFRFKSDGVPTIYRAISPLSWKNHLVRIGSDLGSKSDTIGLSLSFSGDIFIIKGGADFEDLVVHEIGHVLINTPWHSSNPDSVMYPILEKEGKKHKIMEEEVDLIRKGATK